MSIKDKDIFEKEAKLRLKARRQRHRKPYQKKRVIIPTSIMGVLVILGIIAFINSFSYQSTDDAFVEGRLISVAPKVAGHIVKMNFNDNDVVKKGDLLLEIDAKDYQNRVNELEGTLKEAIANTEVSGSDIEKSEANLAQAGKNLESSKSKLNFAQKDFNRYTKLRADGLCTKQEYDMAKTKLEVEQANYKEAKDREFAMNAALKSAEAKNQASDANIEKISAQLEQAKLNLSYTKIYAPQDGTISSRNVEVGNYVQVGQALTSIVSPEVWVIANYKETQLTKMKKGQTVEIKVDTYPNKKFKGRIDSIQRSSGAKASLFPPENAVGSYVKVVQRIPVKIVFNEDISKYNIAPGMSVVPKVKIK
jgi:membrane fusion protein (multidrug efflux system)